eukprot:gene15647-biopygen18725
MGRSEPDLSKKHHIWSDTHRKCPKWTPDIPETELPPQLFGRVRNCGSGANNSNSSGHGLVADRTRDVQCTLKRTRNGRGCGRCPLGSVTVVPIAWHGGNESHKAPESVGHQKTVTCRSKDVNDAAPVSRQVCGKLFQNVPPGQDMARDNAEEKGYAVVRCGRIPYHTPSRIHLRSGFLCENGGAAGAAREKNEELAAPQALPGARICKPTTLCSVLVCSERVWDASVSSFSIVWDASGTRPRPFLPDPHPIPQRPHWHAAIFLCKYSVAVGAQSAASFFVIAASPRGQFQFCVKCTHIPIAPARVAVAFDLCRGWRDRGGCDRALRLALHAPRRAQEQLVSALGCQWCCAGPPGFPATGSFSG